MKRCLFAATAAVAAAFAGTPASAQSVTYDTTNSTLTCGSAASCTNVAGGVRFGANDASALFLLFVPTSGAVTAPSNIGLGEIDSNGLAAPTYDITGVLLNLVIFSSPPGSTGGLPQGSIAGTLAGSSSNATLSFLTGGVTIGGFTYTVTNSPLSVNPPSASNGITSIQGRVTGPVPEPATWAMMLLGFGGIGMAMRRRRQPSLAQVA